MTSTAVIRSLDPEDWHVLREARLRVTTLDLSRLHDCIV
jgi:hypothetical protein